MSVRDAVTLPFARSCEFLLIFCLFFLFPPPFKSNFSQKWENGNRFQFGLNAMAACCGPPRCSRVCDAVALKHQRGRRLDKLEK